MTEQIDDEKSIQSEYMQWRKNIQHLYNLVLNHALDWPALSVQFFPDFTQQNSETTQQILVSTHTSGQESEYLQIVDLTLPDEPCDDTNDVVRFKEKQRIPVTEEINRACYNPNLPQLIATRSDLPDVQIYDTTTHLIKSNIPNPDITLKGHDQGGYGLSWNPVKKENLITAGEDAKICHFDVIGKNLLNTFEGHESTVNDVCFSSEFIFGSVGDDKNLILWDTRIGLSKKIKAANSDVLCCEFSKLNENFVAVGSADSNVSIFDLRNLTSAAYTLNYHKKEVTQVRWSPHLSSVLASSGTDRRVCLWDLESEEKLTFIHGGHTNVVTDVCWNPLEKWELISVAEDNILQVWSPVR